MYGLSLQYRRAQRVSHSQDTSAAAGSGHSRPRACRTLHLKACLRAVSAVHAGWPAHASRPRSCSILESRGWKPPPLPSEESPASQPVRPYVLPGSGPPSLAPLPLPRVLGSQFLSGFDSQFPDFSLWPEAKAGSHRPWPWPGSQPHSHPWGNTGVRSVVPLWDGPASLVPQGAFPLGIQVLAQMSHSSQFHFLHFICQYKNTQIFTTNKYAGTQ